MKAKKIAATGLAAAMSMAVLAGCGPKSEAATTTTVTIAFDADMSSMDNSVATDGSSFSMQMMGLSGLLALDESGTPVPDLAESYDVSDDGLTYTFHLKKDAQWSNGTPITANDVVYSWHRLVSPTLASEYAFILDTMHVVNAADVIAGKKDAKELGVEAVDDHTVKVSLSLPCSFLPSLMAFPPLFPLNEEYVTSQGDQYALSPENMIYSGQYVMTDWKQGNEYTFEKNDKYVNADEAKDKADTVVFKFIQDTQAAMLSYQNGDIDAVKLQGEQVDQYSSQEGFTNRLQGYLWYLSINYNNPIFQNANLRTALSYAVDREAIAKDVLKDGSVAARGFVPSEFATGPDGKDYVDTADTLTEYNPDKAAEYYKKAVAELGKDVSFTLLFEDTEASKSVAENLQAQLQKNCPGLTVTLDQKPKKTRLQLMNSHDYDIGLTRWGPDYADPQTFMDLVTTTSTYNQGSYSNPAYDALIAKAETGEDAANAEARWKDFQEAEKILVQQDHGVIPIYQNGGAMMINPKVSGIRFHSGGVDDYRWMVVSQ